MDAGKFSVLMSVYAKENPGHFDLALKSVLKRQKLPPDEFILVCDGPLTAKLDAVITKYKRHYPDVLKVYRLRKNSGLGRALNYGLEKCSYDLVARADSDDICMPERFEKQIHYLEGHPEIAVLGCDIREFTNNPKSPVSYKKMPASSEKVYQMARFRNPVNHMTAVFRKGIIKEVGSYLHLPYLEDYYLWVRVLAAGYRIENLNKPYVFARIGNGMAQRRGSREGIKSRRVLNQFMLSRHMISWQIYLRNMIAIRIFVYMPTGLKQILYKTLLRK